MVVKKVSRNLKDNLKALGLSRRIKTENLQKHRDKAFKEICEFYGFERPWNLEDGEGEWQELAKRLLSDFIPAFHENKSGRNKKFDHGKMKEIAMEYWALNKSHPKLERINETMIIKAQKTTPVKRGEEKEQENLYEKLGSQYGLKPGGIKSIIDQVSGQIRNDPQYSEFCNLLADKDWQIKILQFPDWRLWLLYTIKPGDIIKD